MVWGKVADRGHVVRTIRGQERWKRAANQTPPKGLSGGMAGMDIRSQHEFLITVSRPRVSLPAPQPARVFILAARFFCAMF